MPSGHASWRHTISHENRSMATLKVHSDGSFAKVPAPFCGGKDHMIHSPSVSSIYQTFLDSPQSGISAPRIHEMFPSLFRLYSFSKGRHSNSTRGHSVPCHLFLCRLSYGFLMHSSSKTPAASVPKVVSSMSVFLKMEPGFPRVQEKPGC